MTNPGTPTGERKPDLVVVPEPADRAPLLREALGTALRQARHSQGRTLKDVADRAGVSIAHLSEIERGRKEASSEVVAAITGALGGSLLDLLSSMATVLAPAVPASTKLAAA